MLTPRVAVGLFDKSRYSASKYHLDIFGDTTFNNTRWENGFYIIKSLFLIAAAQLLGVDER